MKRYDIEFSIYLCILVLKIFTYDRDNLKKNLLDVEMINCKLTFFFIEINFKYIVFILFYFHMPSPCRVAAILAYDCSKFLCVHFYFDRFNIRDLSLD